MYKVAAVAVSPSPLYVVEPVPAIVLIVHIVLGLRLGYDVDGIKLLQNMEVKPRRV